MNQEFVLILFQVLVLLLAFSVHESAHAYTAMRLGDPTAYMLGRVTLNPLKHIDPLGSVVLPLISLVYGGFLIGWAKPCPVTPRNFHNIKRDDILVSLAGPAGLLAVRLCEVREDGVSARVTFGLLRVRRPEGCAAGARFGRS